MVKKDFTAAEDFFSLVLDAHIVAAAMHFFGMRNITDLPTQNEFLGDLNTAPDDEEKKYIRIFTKSFVKQFAMHHVETLENESAPSTDGVFEYARAIIGFGLMACNFSDATSEGDGERLLRVVGHFSCFILRQMGEQSMQWKHSDFLHK